MFLYDTKGEEALENVSSQVTANNPLAKPGNFEEARETESKCVKFAKEVSAPPPA